MEKIFGKFPEIFRNFSIFPIGNFPRRNTNPLPSPTLRFFFAGGEPNERDFFLVSSM
jgi:hypothetical protein